VTNDVKERPILFSAPMVRAILDGRKVQTRRVVKLRDKDLHDDSAYLNGGSAAIALGHGVGGIVEWREQNGQWFGLSGYTTVVNIDCPYGQVGDRLRVKESAWMWCKQVPNGKTKTGRDKFKYVPLREAPVFYVADDPERPTLDVQSSVGQDGYKWRFKVGRFLPAWACRIELEVTGVRVERLREISEADANAEGCAGGHGSIPSYPYNAIPREHFKNLWESINGAGSWEASPFVWVVSFRRIK
jgi:hypothetical protein